MTTNNNNGRDLQEISREMGLEISPKVGPMTWYEAQNYCKSLGEGWRLPTIDELRAWLDMGVNLKWDFCWDSFELADNYWSSSKFTDDCPWFFSFYYEFAEPRYANDRFHVRAVRELPSVEVRLRIGVVGMTTEEYKTSAKRHAANYVVVAEPNWGSGDMFFLRLDTIEKIRPILHWDGNGSIVAELTPELESLIKEGFEFNIQDVLGGAILGGIDWFDDGTDQYQIK